VVLVGEGAFQPATPVQNTLVVVAGGVMSDLDWLCELGQYKGEPGRGTQPAGGPAFLCNLGVLPAGESLSADTTSVVWKPAASAQPLPRTTRSPRKVPANSPIVSCSLTTTYEGHPHPRPCTHLPTLPAHSCPPQLPPRPPRTHHTRRAHTYTSHSILRAGCSAVLRALSASARFSRCSFVAPFRCV